MLLGRKTPTSNQCGRVYVMCLGIQSGVNIIQPIVKARTRWEITHFRLCEHASSSSETSGEQLGKRTLQSTLETGGHFSAWQPESCSQITRVDSSFRGRRTLLRSPSSAVAESVERGPRVREIGSFSAWSRETQ